MTTIHNSSSIETFTMVAVVRSMMMRKSMRRFKERFVGKKAVLLFILASVSLWQYMVLFQFSNHEDTVPEASLLFLESDGRGVSSTKSVTSRFRSSPYVIFYNVFIPEDDFGRENALRIVREQVEYIKGSYAARSQGQVILFYVTLGAEGVLPQEVMQQEYCGDHTKMSCHHLEHKPSGREVDTLVHMHQFCVEHEPATVVYLHNKGSFHFKEINENWRRMLTAAALSEMCLTMTSNCNLCGLIFYSQWTMVSQLMLHETRDLFFFVSYIVCKVYTRQHVRVEMLLCA
jgi:hypothetical protein